MNKIRYWLDRKYRRKIDKQKADDAAFWKWLKRKTAESEEKERLQIREGIVHIKPQPVSVYHSYAKPTIPEWFETKDIEFSPAEKLISEQLSQYNGAWYREVSFNGFLTPRKGHYRFDFWIPSIRTIIEYDGHMWHSSEQSILADDAKNRFCKQYEINLVRYNRKDYHKISERIAELMSTYHIKKDIL